MRLSRLFNRERMTEPPLKMKTVNSILPELCVSFCPSVFGFGGTHPLRVVPSVRIEDPSGRIEDPSAWSHDQTVHFE